jgi:hypothetical protein
MQITVEQQETEKRFHLTSYTKLWLGNEKIMLLYSFSGGRNRLLAIMDQAKNVNNFRTPESEKNRL